MSVPTSGPRSNNSHRRQKTPVVAIVLVVVGMLVLFGAGFGLTRIIQGATSGDSSSTASDSSGGSSSEPIPCVTVTVTPGAGVPSPSQVTTNVYNATDRTGLAATTAEELQKRGFVIGTIDNDPLSKTVTVSAEIRHGPSGESAARLMSFYFPGSILVNDNRKDATIDTVIGSAFTAVAAQSQVDAAIAAPSPSPSGPGCPKPSSASPASGSATPSESASPEASEAPSTEVSESAASG